MAGTTAVSIGSQVMHMLTVMIVGLAMGATVRIGRAVGAKDDEMARESVGNTAALFMGLSVAATCLLLLGVNGILELLSTPEEAVGGTRAYLTVCFIGIPCITAYNIISSIFRGMGDSKSPMVFVAIACAANIALDVLFMGALKLGPVGAALGTTLSQALSVAAALRAIIKRKMIPGLAPADFKPKRQTMAALLKVGVPVALQDGLIQVGFIAITIIANMRGLNDSAAVGIVEKIIGILFLVPSTLLSHGFGAGGAEYRRGGAWACAADSALCGGDGGWLRPGYRRNDAVCGGRRGVAFRQGGGGHPARRGISARLCVGLPVRGHSFQLQRLLLRVWSVGHFVFA